MSFFLFLGVPKLQVEENIESARYNEVTRGMEHNNQKHTYYSFPSNENIRYFTLEVHNCRNTSQKFNVRI